MTKTMAKTSDNGNRFYEVDVDGRTIVLPSVTTILKILDKGDGFLRWKMSLVANYIKEKIFEFGGLCDDKISIRIEDLNRIIDESKSAQKNFQTASANVGIKVHNYIEKYIKFKLKSDDMDKSFEDEETKNLLCEEESVVNGYMSFKEWAENFKFKPLHSEIEVYDVDLGYAGKIDCVGLIGDKIYVIDFKTSSNIYDEYLLQISAYVNAYNKMFPEEKAVGMAILRLPREEKKYYWVDYSKMYPYYFGVFEKCCIIYNERERLKEMKLED